MFFPPSSARGRPRVGRERFRAPPAGPNILNGQNWGRLQEIARLGVALLGVAPFGCGEPPTEPATELPATEQATAVAPPGTVLRVNDLPLAAEEVDRLAADVSELYPEFSRVHARRLALTNEFLPRLAVRAAAVDRWEQARAACAEANDGLEERIDAVFEGTFSKLGVGLWSAARHLALEEWSAPIELTGRWVRLRLEERTERPDPREERLRIAVVEFRLLPHEDERAAVESAIDRARLTLLDADFAEAVPEAWRHRMRGPKP